MEPTLPEKVLWLLGLIEEGVAQQAETFHPDEDFTTVIHALDEQGQMTIMGMVGFDSERLAEAIPIALRRQGNAIMASLVVNGWMTQHDIRKPLLIRPSKDPDRVEVVTIHVAYEDGVVGSTAIVKRHKKRPPTLKPWERHLHPQSNAGALPAALLRGLSTTKTPA